MAIHDNKEKAQPPTNRSSSPLQEQSKRANASASLHTINTSTPPRTPSASSPKNDSSTPSKTPSSPSKPLVFKKPTSHRFSWKELERMVSSKDLTPMGRSEAVQEAYQKAIKKRTKKYGNPGEYIRQRVLHWPPLDKDPAGEAASDGNESSGSCSSTSSPPSSPTGPLDPLEIALKKNEFPYSVKDGIEHWLIWSRHPLTDEDWILRYLEERLPGRCYLFFVNPPELRSVPSIFHVQVFTKGSGEVLDEEDMEEKQEAAVAAAAAAESAADRSDGQHGQEKKEDSGSVTAKSSSSLPLATVATAGAKASSFE